MPKVSSLPAGTTPTGTETIPAVQGGITVKLTATQIADSVAASLGFETPEQHDGGTTASASANTLAIQAIIDASAGNGALIRFGSGTYSASDIAVNQNKIVFEGCGRGVTILRIEPTADGHEFFRMEHHDGVSQITGIVFRSLTLTSHDVSFVKTILAFYDQSDCELDDVEIIGNANTLTGGTTGSTGVRVNGRQFMTIHPNCYIYADRPMVIGKNPNSYLSDHYDLKPRYLLGTSGGTYPLVNIEDGVTLTNVSLDGVAFVRGTDGIRGVSTLCRNHVSAITAGGVGHAAKDVLTVAGGTFTVPAKIKVLSVTAGVITSASVVQVGNYTVLPSNPVSISASTGAGTGATFTLVTVTGNNVAVRNSRFEQGPLDSTSYCVNLELCASHSMVIMENIEMAADRKGFRGRNIQGLTLEQCEYIPAGGIFPTEGLNVDSTVEPVELINCKWATGTTFSTSGLTAIEYSATPTGHEKPPFITYLATGTAKFVPNIVINNISALGATSGALAIKAAAIAGSNTLTLPAGTTDFSSTGGTSQFVKQNTAGGALTVVQPSFNDLSGNAGANQGGTGIASYAVGDLLYASATTTLSKLADVATGNALISGGITTAPAWGKVGLTTHISGTLAVGNGGTGQTTLTSHGVLIGNGSSAVTQLTAGVTGQVLRGNTGADPFFSYNLILGLATGATGSLLLAGNTSGTVTIQPQDAAGTYNFNLPTSAGSSGQPLLSGGGGSTVMTFGTLANAALANMADKTFKGNNAGSTGAPLDLTAAQAAAVLATVGGVLNSKVVTATYDLSTASGTQSVTGVGFQPTSVLILASVGAGATAYSFGFADSALNQRTINDSTDSANFVMQSGNIIRNGNGAGTTQQSGVISAYAADGFTITWTKTGSPTGTLQIYALCYR